MPETRGFVYATTGADYTALARRSARSLALAMPGARIDLFTDQPVEDPVFERIHRLDSGWFRPKMQAIRQSRFRRSVVLDADVIVLTDVAELFDLLDDVDLAGCQAAIRPPQVMAAQADIPRAFPMLNSGMLVTRASPAVQGLVTEWEERMRALGHTTDQPLLRRLLYQRRLPFMVVPPEYNFIHIPSLDSRTAMLGAPRILHVRSLHDRPPGDPDRPFDLTEALGEARADVVRALWAEETARPAPARRPAAPRAPLPGGGPTENPTDSPSGAPPAGPPAGPLKRFADSLLRRFP